MFAICRADCMMGGIDTAILSGQLLVLIGLGFHAKCRQRGVDDEQAQTLVVSFCPSRTCRCFGVPSSLYEWLLRAKSRAGSSTGG